MLTTQQRQIIANWRKNWCTSTSKKKLAITGCSSMSDVISTAIDKAHAPSVVRALKTNGISTQTPRAVAKKTLENELDRIIKTNPIDVQTYNDWAIRVEKEIVEIYSNRGISDYTLGNAQKLVSMTMKYIFSADNVNPDLPVFKVAHIPIDRRIMDVAKDKLGVNKTASPWSKINKENEITNYQDCIRQNMTNGYFPMLWECENW